MADKSETHQTILMIVHGIGEQRSEETIDRFVGAATEILGLHGRVSGHTELLVDHGKGKTPDRQMQPFPCAIRRTTIAKGLSVGERCLIEDHEVLAAEVYWADLSSAPRGPLGIITDLLHTVLALGYLAIDNVELAADRGAANAAWLVRAFVWLFYTVIAPCNALMLAGALMLLVIDLVIPADYLSLAVVATMAFLVWAGLALYGSGRWTAAKRGDGSYLARCFWIGVAAAATILAVTTIVAAFDSADADLPVESLIESTAALLVGAMIAGWGGALCLLVAMVAQAMAVLLTAIRRKKPRWSVKALTAWVRDNQTVYIQGCIAMMILWTTLSASFWSLLSLAVTSLPVLNGSENIFQAILRTQLDRATATLAYILIGCLALIAAGVPVGWLRSRCKADLSRAEDPALVDVWLGRVIVNPLIAAVLFLLVLYLGYASITALWALLCEFEISWACAEPSSSPLRTSALLVASIIGLLILVSLRQLRAGLGVARDVTSYSIRSGSLSRRSSSGLPHYPVREQMLGRFRTVLTYLEGQMPQAARLIVVAHSQGTVIAASALAHHGCKASSVHLVTMGSPLGHIYRQYFRDGFDMSDLEAMQPHWLNIYRCDDFVGTSITLGNLPVQNRRVESGGHLNYWTDRQVWKRALEAVGIRPCQNGTSSPPAD